MAATQVSVDVPVRLQVMQDSINKMKRVLGGLKPDSAPFKGLENIIKSMTSQMEKFQVQTSKSFSSPQQFKQANKTLDQMEESLTRAKLQIEKINFGDLKLQGADLEEFKNLSKELENIQANFRAFKEETKIKLFENVDFKSFADKIDPNLINKNFDEVVKAVESKTKQINTALQQSEARLNSYASQIKIGNEIKKIANNKTGGINANTIGSLNFDEWFRFDKNNKLMFKSGGRSPFFEWMQSAFTLNDSQKAQLQQMTAAQLNDFLKSINLEDKNNFFALQLKNAENAAAKQPEVINANNTAKTNAEEASKANRELASSQQEVAEKSRETASAINDNSQKTEQFGQRLQEAARHNQSFDQTLGTMAGQLEGFRTQLAQTNAQFLQLERAQRTFNSIKMAITNFMGFNQVLNLTRRAVQEAANHIKQLDTVMNGIAIVTDMTTADLWNQVDAYSEMAQRYGTTIQGAYEVSKIYYQAGYETNDVLTLMNETLKLSKVSGLDYATTTDYMMTATRGFHMEVSEAAQVVDVYSALAANTAVSQQELAEAMSKTASSMESVGATFQESSAMIATMVAVTRESANNIGSALKSIGARYGELTKDPTKLFDAEGEAMSFNKVDTALKSVGISLQTTDHQFRDFTDVIMELASMWDTLDSAQQRYIATTFAGNRQQSRFLALVSNKDLLQENMDVAAASEDTGTLQALKALDSLESKLNQVQVAYQQFYTSIGAEGVWKSALDGIKSFIDTLNSFPKLFGKIPIGAISVVIDVISTVKGLALSAFAEVAGQLSKTLHNAQEQMSQQGATGGNNLMNGLVKAIQSRKEEIQNAIKNATEIQVAQAQVDRAKEYKAIDPVTTIGGAVLDSTTGYELNIDELITKMQQAQDVTAQEAQELRNLFNTNPQAFIDKFNEIVTKVEETGNAAILAGQKAQQGASGFQNFIKSSQHLASDLGALGSALNMIGSLINTTSRQGQIASGSIQLIAGAFKAAQVGVLAFKAAADKAQWSNVFTAAAGAVLVLVNAIATLHETGAEKLERLTKEAEEFSNQAKEAKANYNTLQKSIDKLDELKQKRYDSVEATEEYQDAVDELAEKFPYLVTGLDSAGNAIIETSNLEHELEAARRAAAKATLEAAKAERDKIQADVDITEAEQEERKRKFNNKSALSGILHLEEPINFTEEEKLAISNDKDSSNTLSPLRDEEQILYYLSEFKNFNGIGFSDMETGGTPYIKDTTAFLQSFDKDSIAKLKKESDMGAAAARYLEYYNNNLRDFYEINEAIQNLDTEVDEETFNADINEIINRIEESNLQEDFDTFLTYAKAYKDGLIDLGHLKEGLASSEKVELSAAINTYGESQQEFVKELGDGSAVLANWLYNKSQQYLRAHPDKTIEDYINYALKDDYTIFEESFNTNLDYNFKNRFQELWENRSQYTADDIIKELELDRQDPLSQAIYQYYRDNNLDGNFYAEQLQKKLGLSTQYLGRDLEIIGKEDSPIRQGLVDLYNSLSNAGDKITTEFSGWISQGIDIINDYESKGLFDHATSLASNLGKVLTAVDSLEGKELQQARILFAQNNLNTVEGVNSLIEDLEQAGFEQDSDIITSLQTLKESLLYNLPLAIESYTDQILTDIDSLEKEIKNISNGLSFSEAYAALEKINTANNTNYTLSDLKIEKGKLYFDNDRNNLQALYLDAITGDLQSTYDEIEGQIIDISKEDSKINKQLSEINFTEDTFDISIYEDLYKILADLGFAEGIKDEEGNLIQFKLTEEGILNLIESGNDPAQVIIDLLTGRLGSARAAIEYANKMLPAETALNTGDYQSYLREITDNENLILNKKQLEQIASTGNYGQLDYTSEIKPLKDKLNSVYSSLISDVLSKGIENVRPEDYEGLIGDTFDPSGSYVDFVHRYAALAGYTVEETNDLIIQAIEKDSATTTGAAAETIKDINFLPRDMAYASLDTLKELADIYGVAVEELFDINDYNEALGGYKVNMARLAELGFDQIEDASATVKDSVLEFLKSIADAIEKGLQGKLNYAGMDNLIDSVSQYGIELSEADFTRTVDGLKLSDEAAIDLYRQLSAVDGLSGQIVFDAMRSSLEEAGKGFANISESSARIAELQREIAKQTKNIQDGQLHGAPKEWVDSENEKLNKLKQELQLAQEIQRAQSQNPDQYDFMGRDLPDYLKGPENYWNSTGEAFKAMRESSKSGYMEIDDFYNIVNEMNNLAAISGQSFEFLGTTIDKEGQGAAQLIERGLGALSNVDGEGVKIDLSQLGVDFKTGAADMGEDFDDAVKVMAKSQIKMLDGMIQLLETVVAMEKLGDIDVDGDNIFSIGDLFKLDEEGNPIPEYTEQYQQYATDTLEAAKSNAELDNALKTFKINGISLKEMLEDATDGTKELNISEEAYFAAMNAVVTAAESGDYDPENWMSSIQEILAGTGQVFEIDAGDGTSIVIGYGATIEKNEKGEYVYNGQTYDTAEEAAKVAALDGIGATDIKTEIIDGEIHVTGKITIGEQEIEVEQTKDGTIYKSDKTGGSYSSIDELIAKEFEADNQKDHGITLEEWTIQQGYKIVPEIDSSELELTPQQVKNLVGKTAKDLEKDASTMTDVQFQATYGVKWKQGTTDDVLQQVKEQAGIESQNVELTLSVTTADDNSQKVLDILQTEAPSTPINVNIKVNSDDTGLFGPVEGENNPTKDITVTLNNGESIDLAVTGVDTSTDTWTINGITATGETISLGQADISGLSFKEGWSLSSPVGQDGVDLGAATISNLNQNEDGSWALDTVNGSISLTADEVSGLLDETLTLTKDATGNLILTPNAPDVDITTDAADATMEAWRAAQETKKIKQQVEVEETENPSAKSLMDTRLKIANTRSSESIGSFSQGKNNFTENVNWLTGRGNATQEAKDYLNNLNSIVESGQKLGSVDLSNLTYLQSVFTGVDSEAVSQINNLINMSAVNADSLDQTGQFLNSLAMVDIGQLPEIAVALEAITNQATLLQGVDWAAIAQGLTDVANAQTASNEAGAQANSLVDTSSLAVAVGEIGSAVDSVTNYINTLKAVADQINDVAAAIETIKTDKIDAIQTAQNNIDHDKVDAIQTAQSQIRSDRIEAIKNAAATIDASHARAARDAINSIKNKVDVSIDLKVSASGGVSVGSVNGRPGARGNVALAKGTLMGELGEELVVSGGRYFLVGQTGPEFVDLAPDAIVFNHLQTKHLLQNGYSPTRGKPVTNDRKATSFATGNIDGPALASASSALAALKQIRAMWQRLLDASLKDLGGMGSPTGGGGGGGGGGEDDKKELEGITAEIEEWYNWLRRIDQLQKEINTKQKEYNNLLKDRVGNGDKIYTNLKDQIELMRQQRAYELGLAKAQEERRNAELEKLTTGPASDVFNAFYRWNDVTKAIERSGDQVFADFIRAHGDTAVANALQTNGQITVTTYKEQTEEEKKEGKEREKETATFSIPANGMDFLRELTEQDASGKIKYNAEQQFQILRQMGFGNWMQYDTQGKALFEKGIDNATQEEMQNAVETFITRWETMPDYFIGLNDSITEHGDQAEELLGNIYDNIDTIVQNQIEVENSVLKAIEDMRQAEIDAVQDERDAFADAADKMINGLNDALNKERQMYQNNENQKEVERLQRQLAILQRSGGSGSQIQNLQQQLASKQQDTYFTERQEQIDAIKEASDKQIEKMDRQIELMTETLDYQKENGLLWGQVYEILARPANEVLDFIVANDKDMQALSAQNLDNTINGPDGLRDKIGFVQAAINDSFDANKVAEEARHVDDVNLQTSVDSIDSNVSAINAANGSTDIDLADSDKEESSGDDSGSGKGKRQSFKDRVAAAQNQSSNWFQRVANDLKTRASTTAAARAAGADAARNTATNTVSSILSSVGKIADKLRKTSAKNAIADSKAAKKGIYRYATGGLNTEEGWAWLDGTPSRPEYVLNAEQTDILREALLGTSSVTTSLNSAAYSSRSGMANGSTYSTISNDSGVEIENVNMTLEVKSINNDYDARRAGEQALNEMVRIARKSGNRSLSRR